MEPVTLVISILPPPARGMVPTCRILDIGMRLPAPA